MIAWWASRRQRQSQSFSAASAHIRAWWRALFCQLQLLGISDWFLRRAWSFSKSWLRMCEPTSAQHFSDELWKRWNYFNELWSVDAAPECEKHDFSLESVAHRTNLWDDNYSDYARKFINKSKWLMSLSWVKIPTADQRVEISCISSFIGRIYFSTEDY